MKNRHDSSSASDEHAVQRAPAVGKRTLTSRLAPVQRRADRDAASLVEA